ncbi:MAG: triple tyrosine motif-containing protein, partial [Verrucomicrobia bacterium]|nr:triple tyrosine motif-containing protein [Verrucomicrobiota bacterium]
MRKLIAVLAMFSAFVALTTSAARPTFRSDPDYLIDTWEIEDGWPASAPRAMAQSPDGYLWMGTSEGLVRFDGVKFTLFDQTSLPKLPHKAIVKLLLDRSGKLWVGTVNGVAARSGTDWRTVALPGTNNNRGNHLVHTLAERPGGDLLLTTYDGGVLEFTSGQFRPLPPPPGETNTSYWGCSDDAGNWWVAQHKFIGKWDGHRWVETVSLAETPELVPGQVCCVSGREGGLWLLLGSELRQYRNGKATQRTLLTGFKGEVSDFLEDSRGNVWIGTLGAGLWQISSKGLVSHWSRSNGLANNNVPSVFEDRERNVWVGAGHGGLTRFKQRTFHSFLTVADRLAFARFAVSASPTGDVFIAAWRDGLWRANTEGVTKVPLPKPFAESSVSALSLLVDRSGCYWIGAMTNGVWRIKGEEAQWMPIDDSGRSPIRALFEDSHGRVWMAGGQSVSAFDAGTMRGFGPAQGLPPGLVSAFAEDKAGVIWLVHARGVFRLETNRWVEVFDPRGASFDMDGLFVDPDGTLWMGSVEQGLSCWRDGRLFQKSLPPALPMRGAYTFLEDSLGFIWMTSPQGVLRARKSDLKAWLEGRQPAVQWQMFNASDGLPALDCRTSARDALGRLWFATARGVARVDSSVDHPDPTVPPVHIEQLTYHRAAAHVYGGEAEGAPAPMVQSRLQSPFPERLMLPSGSRRLQIHYTALDFSAPEKLRFQTRLEPNDPDWQDVGDRRVAYYYDFTPGSYVFRVRAVNHGGVGNETGASLAFTVQPYLWQTLWFKTLVLVVLAAAAYGGFHRRVIRLQKERAVRQAFTRQLILSQENERKRVASELHDGLGQDLLLVKNRLAMAATRQADTAELNRQLDA